MRTTPAEAPLPDALLDRLQQVVGLQLLDGHVGIAGDAEGVGFDDVHAGEERDRRLAAMTCSSQTKSRGGLVGVLARAPRRGTLTGTSRGRVRAP